MVRIGGSVGNVESVGSVGNVVSQSAVYCCCWRGDEKRSL